MLSIFIHGVSVYIPVQLKENQGLIAVLHTYSPKRFRSAKTSEADLARREGDLLLSSAGQPLRFSLFSCPCIQPLFAHTENSYFLPQRSRTISTTKRQLLDDDREAVIIAKGEMLQLRI